jgi:hypothetical protein
VQGRRDAIRSTSRNDSRPAHRESFRPLGSVEGSVYVELDEPDDEELDPPMFGQFPDEFDAM